MLLERTHLTQPIRRESNRLTALLSLFAAFALLGMVPQPGPLEHSGPARPSTSIAPATTTVATLFDALSRCRAALPESERWRIAGTIHQESRKYGYDPLFVEAMIEVESQCKPTARGIRGAIGLIQIKPATAKAVAEESGLPWRGAAALKDGPLNIRLGVRYLWNLEQRFDDPRVAVAAYNLGPTRVARMARQRAKNARYVQRVMSRYHDLVKQYS